MIWLILLTPYRGLLFAFSDYKFAQTIVAADDSSHFSGLLLTNVIMAHSILIFRTVYGFKTLAEQWSQQFTNSYIVLIRKEREKRSDEDTFVKHVSEARAYRIITLIEEQEDGRIRVRKGHNVCGGRSCSSLFDNYRAIESMDSPESAKSIHGKWPAGIGVYWGVSFEQTISKPYSAVCKLILLLLKITINSSGAPVKQKPSSDSKFATFSNCDAEFDCLQVRLIDLIPENIIIDSRDKQHYHIDCEWLIDARFRLICYVSGNRCHLS